MSNVKPHSRQSQKPKVADQTLYVLLSLEEKNVPVLSNFLDV